MTGFGYNINTLGAYPNRSVSIDASGGTVTTSGGYTIHTFNSSGTFTVNSGSGNVEYLIIAGAGAGGGGTAVAYNTGVAGGANTGGGAGAGNQTGGSGVCIIRYQYQ